MFPAKIGFVFYYGRSHEKLLPRLKTNKTGDETRQWCNRYWGWPRRWSGRKIRRDCLAPDGRQIFRVSLSRFPLGISIPLRISTGPPRKSSGKNFALEIRISWLHLPCNLFILTTSIETADIHCVLVMIAPRHWSDVKRAAGYVFTISNEKIACLWKHC